MFAGMQAGQFDYAGEPFTLWHHPHDASARGSIIEIVERDEYRLSRFRDVEHAVFLDIGANNGLVSLILGKLNPRAQVIAVEPIRELCAQLERNLVANAISNVTVLNRALHCHDEGTVLHLAESCSGASSTLVDNRDAFERLQRAGEERSVGTISFDTLIRQYVPGRRVHLMKVDCEGGEHHLPDSVEFARLQLDYLEGEFHETAYGGAAGSAARLFEQCKAVVTEEMCVTVLTFADEPLTTRWTHVASAVGS